MREIIMLVIVIILFLAAIIRNIDWRAKAVKWVGNNPTRSQHYISAGDTVHTVEGHRIIMAAEGQTYAYVDNDKETYIIQIPKNYPYKYIRGRRIIGQSDGQLVADPLGFFRKDQIDLVSEGLTETSKLLQSNVLVKAVHSVKSNKAQSIIIYLLIGAIVVGGILWWRNNQSKKNEPAATANVTQVQPVTTPAGNEGQYKITPVTPVVP